jgi:uncharacterized protein
MKHFCTRFLLLALLLCSTAQAEVAVPKLTHRITDLTATLNAEEVRSLESRLAAFEAGKGSQIAVLLLPSTQPETVEQFGIRVTDEWKLGRKGVDDGVLLLIAKDDHKLRIEVGYGLEGALNDATAKRIVSETIAPYLKRGDFYGGIDAGIGSIIKVVEGEALPPPAAKPVLRSLSFEHLLGIAFVIFMLGNIILRQWLGELPSGLVIGALIAGLVWLAFLSLLWTILAGVIAFILSLIFGSGRWDSFPTWWGGGGGSGGGFGGGDFGGGGGGFGGGGASGDW